MPGKLSCYVQGTHWETADRTVWENLFPAATIIASEAVDGAGGVAIITPPSVEIVHKRTIVPGCAVMAELRYGGQPIRVLSWYLPPGRRDEVMTQISQAMPTQGLPFSLGGTSTTDNVPAPASDEYERAQMLKGFLAERSSICIDFPGPIHRPMEQKCWKLKTTGCIRGLGHRNLEMGCNPMLDRRTIRPRCHHRLITPTSHSRYRGLVSTLTSIPPSSCPGQSPQPVWTIRKAIQRPRQRPQYRLPIQHVLQTAWSRSSPKRRHPARRHREGK